MVASSAPAPVTTDDREARRERYHREVDRYVIEVLAPKATSCWKPLHAAGKRILFAYAMHHASGRGRGRVTPDVTPDGRPVVSVVESDLSAQETDFARDCMIAAVTGTSFEAEMPRNDGDTVVLLFQAWQLGDPPAADAAAGRE